MKPFSISLLACSMSLVLSGCNSGSSSTTPPSLDPGSIIDIEIASEFYPRGFEASLQNNMNYFLDGIGVSQDVYIPYDHVKVQGDVITPSGYTNISTVALYLNLLIEMAEIGDSEAISRLNVVLSQLEEAPKWQGLFYWLYQFDEGKLAINNSAIASAVDNGIMSFSLAGLHGAFFNHSDERLNDFAIRAQTLLDNQSSGWQALYNPNKGLLYAGWSRSSNSVLSYYIDRKSNESRLATLWAVMSSNGNIPETAFDDMLLVRGEHKAGELNVAPMLTWDGSYFQAMLPALWLDERQLMPNYTMIEDFSLVHAQFADLHNIPFVSASATVDDGYQAFGIKAVSESYRKFNNEIDTGTTGSPHTLALYYMVNPTDALNRLNQLKAGAPQIETIAGWADAIDSSGRVSTKVIGLDQGMFAGAFFADSVRENVETYLTSKGYFSSLESMYRGYIADETVPQASQE